MGPPGMCGRMRGGRDGGQLTGTVLFFFFFGDALFFRTGADCVCFCPIDAGGAVCAGRVAIPGELNGGGVTAGGPAGAAVTCGKAGGG